MDKEKLQIENLLIENYKKFKSANIFIKFTKSTKESEAKVILKYNEIIIKIKDEEHQVDTSEFFTINAKSCYNLLVKGAFISFRIITTDDESRFTSEIIAKSLPSETPKFEVPKLSITPNHLTKIACSNCEHPLTTEKEITFNRILSLPSSGLAMDDWFCHLHSGERVFDSEQSNACFDEHSKSFEPKTSDIFYSHFHLLFNSQIFESTRLREAKGTLHCRRCLQTLGEKTRSSIKLWCESVKIGNKHFFCDSSVGCVTLIRRVLCNHLAHHSLSPIAKVIFEATAPSTQQKVHLLLQIMDRSLTVLRLGENSSKLIEASVVKVMFLKLTRTEDEEEEKTLKYWQSDINSSTFEFSFRFFHEFLSYLERQSQQIPETYRCNNGFQLSYVEV